MAQQRRLALMAAQQECEQTTLSQPAPNDGQLYCNSTWDGWGCWNYTLAGKRAFSRCPSFIDGFDTHLFAYKDCTSSGTWWQHWRTNRTWTNYTTCVDTHDLQKNRSLIHLFVAGYSISMVALLVSLFIFFYFKQLQCDRVTLHKNLFVSYILSGLMWIVYYNAAALNVDVLVENPVWCQGLHVLTQYLVTCNFLWMFCEGLYLHTMIVIAFSTGKKLLISCCLIGWCFPILTTLVYTAVRVTSEGQSTRCWITESNLQWVVFGPIVVTIVINFLFLCNIVRVLITKLRAVNSPDTNQTRKAVRATLILIPLLGLQYILFPLRPPPGSTFEQVYLFSSAFVTSFQGLFVALIFCFFNGEVISIIKRKWMNRRAMSGRGGASRATGYVTQTTMTAVESTAFTGSRSNSIAPPQSRNGQSRMSVSGRSGNSRKAVLMSPRKWFVRKSDSRISQDASLPLRENCVT